MDSAVDKGKSEDDKTEGNKTEGNKTEGNKTEGNKTKGYKGDPCNANKYLGIDLSFLGFFDALPEECELKKESTKISIVGPIEVRNSNQYGGNKAVICKKKSLKRCKRAHVSCKYCRRSTKKSIGKYYGRK
jgi:hypothetical protein